MQRGCMWKDAQLFLANNAWKLYKKLTKTFLKEVTACLQLRFDSKLWKKYPWQMARIFLGNSCLWGSSHFMTPCVLMWQNPCNWPAKRGYAPLWLREIIGLPRNV